MKTHIAGLLVGAALFGSPVVARAGICSAVSTSPDDSGSGECDPSVAGDPVNVLWGSVWHAETDFSVPAGGGLPFTFYHDYESTGFEPGSFNPFGDRNAAWSHSLNVYLHVDSGYNVVVGPTGRLMAFYSSADTNGYFPPVDERTHSTLHFNAATAEFEWRQENGSLYVFEPKLCDGITLANLSCVDTFRSHYLTKIIDASGRHSIQISRSTTGNNVDKEVTSVFIPTYNQLFCFTRTTAPTGTGGDDTIQTVLSAVQLQTTSGANCSSGSLLPLVSFFYDSYGMLYSSLDAENVYTFIHYDSTNPGYLAGISRTKSTSDPYPCSSSSCRDVVDYTWATPAGTSTPLAVSLHDDKNNISFSYNIISSQTTITDEQTTQAVTYGWDAIGLQNWRRVTAVAATSSSAGAMQCLDCRKGTGFVQDRLVNTISSSDTGTSINSAVSSSGAKPRWTSRLYDTDQIVRYASSGSATVTTPSSGHRLLSDSSVSFYSLGVRPGDVFRFITSANLRSCRPDVDLTTAGTRCPEDHEYHVISTPTSGAPHAVELDADTPIGTYAQYWLVRLSGVNTIITGTSATVGYEISVSGSGTFASPVAIGNIVKYYDATSTEVTPSPVGHVIAVIDGTNILVDKKAPDAATQFKIATTGGTMLVDLTGLESSGTNFVLYDTSPSVGFTAVDVTGTMAWAVWVSGVQTAAVAPQDNYRLIVDAGLSPGTIGAYSIGYPDQGYAGVHGGNAIEVIENDQRYDSGAGNCVPDSDPWTEPGSECSDFRITKYGYGISDLPTLLTSVTSTGIVSGSPAQVVYDYDISPSVASSSITCSNVPGDFNVGSFLSGDNDGRIRRRVEYGQERSSSGTASCSVRVWTYSYSASAPYELTSIDGPRSDITDTVSYVYNTSGSSIGRLSTATMGGLTQTFNTYNALGDVTEMTDANGQVWLTTRDTHNRATAVDDPDGNTTTYVYNLADGPDAVESAMGNAMVYAHDNRGRVTAVKRLPSATSTATPWDELDYVTGSSSPNNALNAYGFPNVSRAYHNGSLVGASDFTYDYNRNLNSSKAYRGSLSESYTSWFTSSPEGLLLTEADPNHVATGSSTSTNRQLNYSNLKQLLQDQRTIGTSTAWTTVGALAYDAWGGVVTSDRFNATFPTSESTWQSDDFGQASSSTTSEGGQEKYAYDAAGNQVTRIDAIGTTVTRTFDALGRLTQEQYTPTSGTADSSLVQTWDALASGDSMPTDCIGLATISTPYYLEGHLVKATKGGEVDYYGYTKSGRLRFAGRVHPGSTCMDVTYYSYDANGNLSDIKYPAADPNSSSTPREIQYVRGASGDDPDAIRKVNLITSSGTTTLIDAIDRAAWGGGYTFRFAINGSVSHSKDIVYQLSANLDGTPSQLLAYVYGSGGTPGVGDILINRIFTEDPNGNITGQVDGMIGPASTSGSPEGFRTQKYAYDTLNHLTKYVTQLGEYDYAMDWSGVMTGMTFASGARSSYGSGTATTTVAFSSAGSAKGGQFGEMTQVDLMSGTTVKSSDLTVSYNADGSRASMSQVGGGTTETLSWDQRGVLANYSPSGGSETETTDADGRRAASSLNMGSYTIPTTFLYSPSNQLLVEQTYDMNCVGQTASGPVALRKDYVYLFGMPVAVLFSSPDVTTHECATNYILPNHLGAPLRLLDSGGRVTQSPEVGPYGGMDSYTGDANAGSGSQYSDMVEAFNPTTNAVVPLVTQGSYTVPSSAATISTQVLTVAGASTLQLLFKTLATGTAMSINACSDVLTLAGSEDTTAQVETFSAGNQGTHVLSAIHHGSSVTLTLTSDPAGCSSTCSCAIDHDGYTVATAQVGYSPLTNAVSLGLPFMHQGMSQLAENWHRYFDPSTFSYLSSDPMLRNKSFIRQRTSAGSSISAYAYVSGDPLSEVDPTGFYGTSDCSYYQERCLQSGGDYYCVDAPIWCNRFPKPPDPDPSRDDDFEGWPRCVRQCLQDCDRWQNAGQNTCPPKADPRGGPFDQESESAICHDACYLACADGLKRNPWPAPLR
jgi:RHS repeat-associated protein